MARFCGQPPPPSPLLFLRTEPNHRDDDTTPPVCHKRYIGRMLPHEKFLGMVRGRRRRRQWAIRVRERGKNTRKYTIRVGGAFKISVDFDQTRVFSCPCTRKISAAGSFLRISNRISHFERIFPDFQGKITNISNFKVPDYRCGDLLVMIRFYGLYWCFRSFWRSHSLAGRICHKIECVPKFQISSFISPGQIGSTQYLIPNNREMRR